jgi:hypothetical protein
MAKHIDRNTTYHGDDSLSPEAIELQLGSLIRHYLRTQSPAIAQSVVRHIEQLCAHPGYDGEPADRCAYLRLRAHWRWLAQAR